MASMDQVRAYAAIQRQTANEAQNALAHWLAANPGATRAQIEAQAARIIRQFGGASAVHARDFYVTERRAAVADGHTSGGYWVERGTNVNPDVTARQLSDAFDPDRDDFGLGRVIDLQVEQHGRDVIMRNATTERRRFGADRGPRWASVPIGPTCAWCLMQASRGAVFLTQSIGSGGAGWHASCDCQPVPVWPGQKPPYDVDQLLTLYRRAREASVATGAPGARFDSDDGREAARAFRQWFPDLVADGWKTPWEERRTNFEAMYGVTFEPDIKEHEFVFYERFWRAGHDFELILQPPGTAKAARGDFRWEGTDYELKSVLTRPIQPKHLARPMYESMRDARKHGIVRDTFMVDIGNEPFTDAMRQHVAAMNVGREERLGHARHVVVWSAGKPHVIELL